MPGPARDRFRSTPNQTTTRKLRRVPPHEFDRAAARARRGSVRRHEWLAIETRSEERSTLRVPEALAWPRGRDSDRVRGLERAQGSRRARRSALETMHVRPAQPLELAVHVVLGRRPASRFERRFERWRPSESEHFDPTVSALVRAHVETRATGPWSSTRCALGSRHTAGRAARARPAAQRRRVSRGRADWMRTRESAD